MVKLRFQTIPDGVQYVSEINIDAGEPLSKNDFKVLLISNENVSGLTELDIAVSDDSENGSSEIVSFKGAHLVFEIGVRPPDTGTGEITLSIAENVVREGNAPASITIPYTDENRVPEWKFLFRVPTANPLAYNNVIKTTPERLYIPGQHEIFALGYNGEHFEAEKIPFPETLSCIAILPFGDGYLGVESSKLFFFSQERQIVYESDTLFSSSNARSVALHPQLGLLVLTNQGIFQYSFDEINTHILEADTEFADRESLSVSTGDVDIGSWSSLTIACDAITGKIYLASSIANQPIYTLDADMNLIEAETIHKTYAIQSLSVVNGEFYSREYNGDADVHIFRVLSSIQLDAPEVRESLYPLFVKPGNRVDMSKFLKRFEKTQWKITFDVGSNKPEWLSIEEDIYLKIDAEIDDATPRILKLKCINTYGDTPDGEFAFYLIVEQEAAPIWRDFDALSMYTDQAVDLSRWVDAAPRHIGFAGVSLDTEQRYPILSEFRGFEIAAGVLRAADPENPPTGNSQIVLRALKGDFHTDRTVNISVISRQQAAIGTSTDIRVEIEGIDISDRLRKTPDISISRSLDPLHVDEYVTDRCTIGLTDKAGYFNQQVTGNFWEMHDLNPAGYLNRIEIFVRNGDAKQLLFKGVIIENASTINSVQATLTCLAESYLLQGIRIEDIDEGIQKYYMLQDSIGNISHEGVYALPAEARAETIQIASAEAFIDGRVLTLKDVQNKRKGITVDYTAVVSEQELKTQGGPLSEGLPMLKFKTSRQRFPMKTAIASIASIKKVKSSFVDIDTPILERPFLQTRGNFAFETEPGRIQRLVRDWHYDTTENQLYLLLAGGSDFVSDRLMVYDTHFDRYTLLHEFAADRMVHRFDSADNENFYILTSESPAIDTSEPGKRLSESEHLATDAASGFSRNKIYRYQRSLGSIAEVETPAAAPPQIAMHYWIGFANRFQVQSYEGIVSENRYQFKAVSDGSLFYRYANTTHFGVAAVLPDGTHRLRGEQSHDGFFNWMNFAFDVTDAGDVYFAYIQGTTDESELTLEKWGAAASEAEVIARLPYYHDILESVLGENEGVHLLGVYELIVVDDNEFYVICSVSRNRRDYSKSAGAVLLRYKRSHRYWKVVDTWDFVHWGPMALTYHEGNVYYTESPAVSYRWHPINPDVTGWDAAEGYNVVENADFLKCVDGLGEATTLGTLFLEDVAFQGVYTRGLSFDEGLHFIAGAGDPMALLQADNKLASATNFQWVTWGQKLNPIMDVLPTTGDAQTQLTQLARQMNAYLSFDREIINIHSKVPPAARVAGSLASTVPYQNANKTFPGAGLLHIDSELIHYTSRTETAFEGITRGYLGTRQQAHAAGTEILFIDYPLSESELIGDLNLEMNWLQFYNQVKDSEGLVQVSDAKSIETLSPRTLQLSTGLPLQDIEAIEYLAGQYLDRLSIIGSLVKASLQLTRELQLGDVIAFRYVGAIAFPIQVIKVVLDRKKVDIIGRQITPQNVPSLPPILDPNETFRTTDSMGNDILVDGRRNRTLMAGSVASFAEGIFATELEFEDTVADMTHTKNIRILPVQLPKATGGQGKIMYTLTGLPAGLAFQPRTRQYLGVPHGVRTAMPVTYTATDMANPMHTRSLTFNITVKAESTGSYRTLDGRGDPILVDGRGNVTIFHGQV